MTTPSERPLVLKPDTEITSATHGEYTQYPLIVACENYSGSDDPLWLALASCGAWLVPNALIHARHFESAYEAWIDERPTIDPSELWEAYGFDSEAEYTQAIKTDTEDYPDLIEGYMHQGNCTGTGIVNVGYDDNLIEVTPDVLRRFHVQLSIATID